MADRTVFSRFVFADEGATFFHMASEAGVGNAVALHQLRAGGAMRGVAVRATHLAFKDGVMRWLVGEDALFLVASETDFRLSSLVFHLVMCGMQLMA